MDDGAYIYHKLKPLLSSEFEMKDMGATKKILDVKTWRDCAQNKLFLGQKEYIQKVLNHFGMATTKPVCTLLTLSIHLSELNTTQLESEKEYMSCVPYASVVGSLMYAMVCTRPDLAQAISVVSIWVNLVRNIDK